MFSRLLVANRGEIACRVMRACRRLGIQTVAVHSDADARARHVREADIAVRIGAPEARRSYLDADAIVRAAIDHGAQAIHPGYGFLSEKLELVDACRAHGIVFVGPHREAIARMGSKIESKRIALEAGLHCVPGYGGDEQDDERLRSEARRIGFPLLIKASAGGGGKGMKRVEAPGDFDTQLAAARREALAAFGDDRVLLERCIVRPRHVEVQLLGDRHGQLVHLFERECSIQRNYQKLVEEAPANHLDVATRERLFGMAIALGREIGYDSAGTVEFVLDADDADAPYFLEMNTRLQVEHPVTELVTGIDLVEWQIRVAAGEPLGFAQHEIRRNGWAIEARVNAEVPEQGFRAATGTVHGYCEPDGLPGVRIDSGIDAGSEITPHYDSMIAKVIASGATRRAAAARLLQGVRSLRVQGVQTNQPLLADLLTHPAFDDVLTTGFLAEQFPSPWEPPERRSVERVAAAAAGWYFGQVRARHSDRPMGTLTGFRVTADAGHRARYAVRVAPPGTPQSGPVRVDIESLEGNMVLCRLEGAELRFRDAGTYLECLVDPSPRRYLMSSTDDDRWGLWSDGDYSEHRIVPDVAASATGTGEGAGNDTLRAELPGVVSEIRVKAGDRVTRGEPVAVLEAMKLFHTLAAPRDGVVRSVAASVGQTVAQGSVLLELASAEGVDASAAPQSN